MPNNNLVYLGVGALFLGVGLFTVGGLGGGGLTGQALGDGHKMYVDAPLIEAPIEYDLATDNYVGTHNFQVKIEGIDVINTEFISISGVVSESEEIEFMHGTDPYVRKTAGRVTYEPVTLERTYQGIDNFYGWRLEVENGNIERRDVVITMMDSAFRAIRCMTLDRAWPSAWEMPDMDGSTTGPQIERITLVVERVRECAD